MEKVLFMHTGSANHGCEALVRTTAKVLGGPEKVYLWSFCKEEDEKYGVSDCVKEIFVSEYLSRFSLEYFEALFRRKILKQNSANMDVFIKKIFKNRIAVSIGGDNYCYPWSAKQAMELNKKIRKHAKATVLWGCSIDYEAITPEMEKDLAGYDLITARESLTYERLIKINPNTILVADSAFFLEKQEFILPKEFLINNTVGINVSPLIMQYGTEENCILQNYKHLMQYILEETHMNICLIPHVVWNNNDDRVPISYLYNQFSETGRVCMIEDANCMELKDCISKCRFFVGARTHATIAAYSSGIPTLVVGYSIKSRGIAKDIFGVEENYVLPVQNLKSEMDLTEAFKWLERQEDNIKKHLENELPQYSNCLQLGVEALLKL